MSNVFEYGSAIDIIVRIKNQITIKNKTYQPGEIYTTLNKVRVRFNYAPTNTSMTATKPVYTGTTQNLPQSVTTSFLPLTVKLADLLLVSSNDKKLIQETETRSSDSMGNIILRAKVADKLFIYEDGEKVEDYEYDAETRTISNLTPATSYMISYLSEANDVIAFGLEQEHRPYFEIELIGKGNSGKRTSEMHLILPAVKIDVNPDLTFVDDGVMGVTLNLNIIYKGQEQPVVVFR